MTEESVVPIDEEVPLQTAAALGCGAPTGIGAVLDTAAVELGSKVAIFGCGGIGMSAISAAAAIGAETIVAVDVDDRRLDATSGLDETETALADLADRAAIKPVLTYS